MRTSLNRTSNYPDKGKKNKNDLFLNRISSFLVILIVDYISSILVYMYLYACNMCK